DSKAIARAVAASRPGDAIRFPGGTFDVAAPIVLAGSRTYRGTGSTTVLRRTGKVGPIFDLPDGAADITIENFAFRGGGIRLGAVTRTTIAANSFAAIFDPVAPFGAETAIFMTKPTTDVAITRNTFRDIGMRGGAKGTEAAAAILAYDPARLRISDNTLTRVHQGLSVNFERSRRG
ncbi:MAG: hypothetical protein AAFR76_16000, partial [Planctomycetota bacterium]